MKLNHKFACLLALGAMATSAQSQDVTETYILEDVWLLPSVSHPGSAARQLTGSFEWTYDPAEPENGVGTMLELTLPWWGSDFSMLDILVEPGQLEITLNGNYHGLGVDVSLFFLPELNGCMVSAIDTTRSKFNIDVGIPNQGVVISGNATPDCIDQKPQHTGLLPPGTVLGAPIKVTWPGPPAPPAPIRFSQFGPRLHRLPDSRIPSFQQPARSIRRQVFGRARSALYRLLVQHEIHSPISLGRLGLFLGKPSALLLQARFRAR